MTDQPEAPSATSTAAPATAHAGRRSRRCRRVLVAVVVVLAVILAAAIGGALAITRAPTVASLADAKQGEWSTVELPAPAKNGDGSPYDIFVKPGSSSNLMVFFGDGGLNWNEETATQPITLASSIFGGGNFYANNVPFYEVNTFRGVLSNESPNPFADFTIVYIPTTTGDLGIGNTVASTTAKSGQTATSTFNGYNNSRAALDWVYSSVASPSKVLVAGAGTGGLSSAIWLADVGTHYSSQPLYQLSDSGYIAAQSFPAIIDPVWRAQFESRFGFEPTSDPLSAAVNHNNHQFGSRLSSLVVETLLDRVSANYSAQLDDGYYSPQNGSDWNYGMKSALRALTASGQTFGSPLVAPSATAPATAPATSPAATVYLTGFGADSHGETPHNLTLSGDFAAVDEDGVTLTDWLTTAVVDGHPESVGTPLLDR